MVKATTPLIKCQRTSGFRLADVYGSTRSAFSPTCDPAVTLQHANSSLAIKEAIAANGRYSERVLLRWRWLKPGLVGQCLCLNCEGRAFVHLDDLVGLVECQDCRRRWTLAGFAREHDWPLPPSALPPPLPPPKSLARVEPQIGVTKGTDDQCIAREPLEMEKPPPTTAEASQTRSKLYLITTLPDSTHPVNTRED